MIGILIKVIIYFSLAFVVGKISWYGFDRMINYAEYDCYLKVMDGSAKREKDYKQSYVEPIAPTVEVKEWDGYYVCRVIGNGLLLLMCSLLTVAFVWVPFTKEKPAS